MILAVIGSRRYLDYQKLKDTLDAVRSPIDMIVSGGAVGADALAQQYAQEKGIPITIFYPDRKAHGDGCYAERNKKIANFCDNMVAFWHGGSPGTSQTIQMAEELGKKVFVVMALDKQV